MKKITLLIWLCLFLPCFAQADLAIDNTKDETPILNPEIKNAVIQATHTQAVQAIQATQAVQTIQAIQAASLRGDYQTAEKLLKDYQHTYGEDTQYLTEKARYFALNGNPQEALKMVEPLLKNDPKNKTLLDIKNYALAHLANATTISNPEFLEISPDVNAANVASNAEDYKKAVLLYKQALSKNPNDKAALIGLARTYLFMGNYKDAASTLVVYKKNNGEDNQYLTEEARELAFTAHPQESLNILAPLLKNDPTNDVLLDIKKYATDRLKTSVATTAAGKTVSPKVVGKIAAAKTVSPQMIANRAAIFAKQHKTNANAYAIAAKAYLDADDAKNALVMINDALNLDPKNPNDLLLKADIATRLDNQVIAYQTNSQLYKMFSSTPKVILGLARAANRLNKYDQSAYLYALYVRKVPDDKAAWLEYAYVESFRGNNRKAISILDEYHRRFGDSDVYLAERARILGSAALFTESFTIVNTLLPHLPNNFDLSFANTVDFYYNNQPIEMFQSFKKVSTIEPNSDETNGLWSFIDTPYRSNIGLDAYHSFDTDSVKISHATLSGQYYLSPLTSLIGNFTTEGLTATVASGLNPIEGGSDLIKLNGVNVGINNRINSMLSLQGLIGGQDAGNGEKSLNYEADVITNLSETFAVNFEVNRAFYDQSARAVSLGVKQNLGQVTLSWQPWSQSYLIVNGGYATFTDDNTMRTIQIHPIEQIIASEKLNVSVGVDGLFNKFGRVLSDGYYSPTNYKYGGITTDFYYKYSDNIGYDFAIGIGTQHDETFITWRPANDYTFKALYGIYQDWYLTFTGALSTRGRSIANNRSSDSTYKVYAFDFTLTRRLG